MLSGKNRKLKAVILAAGEGVRMRPLTNNRPKPLVEVGGKPLLYYTFRALPKEVTEVAVVVGYLAEQVQEYFGTKYERFTITYVHQAEKRGTAHALGLCREFLGDGRFILLYADDLQSPEDVERCAAYPLAVLAKEVDDPRRFGVLVPNADDTISQIVEKPEILISNLAATGVSVLDSRIFNYQAPQHKNGEQYITDSIAGLAKVHPVKIVRASFWFPIGYPEDIVKAEALLKERQF